MADKELELSADELTFVCDPDQFQFETTNDLPDLQKIIGQERAVRAIDFGVEIPSYGFNIYAMGPAGTGKATTVHTFLDRKVHQEPAPDDWCYVNNFIDPKRPRAIQLPSGYGNRLREDMEEFILDLQRSIPTAFDSDDYLHRAEAVVQEMERARNAILKELDAEVSRRGFALVQTAMGLVVAPMVDGQVLNPEQYAKLPEEMRSSFEAHRQDLQEGLDRTMREARGLEKTAKEKLRELDREVANFVASDCIDDLEQKYAAYDEITEYLAEVRQDVVENVSDFRQETETKDSDQAGAGTPIPPAGRPRRDPFTRYRVNVIIDHSRSEGAPVVYATNPTYRNLVGRIEQEVYFGVLTTDFTHIRPGCLHHANSGYLVVNARDLLTYPFAWDALKRAIKNREIRTEMVDEALPVTTTIALEPEPIPFQAKVILIGDASTYYMLYGLDEDFRKLFKVRADFGQTMDRSPEAMQSYAEFIASRVRADDLLPFDRTAVAKVIEFGARAAAHKEKLAARFVDVVEVIQESAHWARQNEHPIVTDADVDQALEERRYRASHLEDRLRERILEGTIRIQTEGKIVGQVNGLTILSMADYEFGVPSRISARTYMGRGGVVAIDREAHLAGNIHNKGVLILQGYLGGKYARRKPLSLAASLTFEQSYERIDGDSASSAELYALLSSLSGLPIRQDLAVTGSVDQQGRVQAIGGASFKIEGYFAICRARELTGTQGVLIPADNVRHLVLRRDVVQAVKDGKFHIYAIETIDQGIQLLTGVPAGEADQEGNYPEGTVNYLVQQKLLAMAEEKPKEGEEDKESSSASQNSQVERDPSE
ncbi:MAG: AAA family ATPase [Anaerolineales bacterium]|nr:MAG: AAA family ATPase [Anaerolineales bacterium]